MKIIISLTAICLSFLSAQIIEISKQQQSDLGIKMQKATAVESVSLNPYNGKVVLDKKDVISISSNIESIIKEIYVSDFQKVKKGEKLLSIKSNALLDIQRAYIESFIESRSATENYERDVKLEADGIISKKRLSASKKLYDSLHVRVQLSANQLLTNGFTQSMIQRLSETNRPIIVQDIYAPKDGVVDKVNVNVGEYVQADKSMIRIYADGKRFIELSVPVKEAQTISIGDNCEFSKYSAVVTAIGNIVNDSSQSVQVRAKIKNAEGIMINRVYGVKIHKRVEGAVKIKKSALVFQDNDSYVFKKVESGFEVIGVEIIGEGAVCYIVKAELNAGDKLAVSSTAALLSAMEVQDE